MTILGKCEQGARFHPGRTELIVSHRHSRGLALALFSMIAVVLAGCGESAHPVFNRVSFIPSPDHVALTLGGVQNQVYAPQLLQFVAAHGSVVWVQGQLTGVGVFSYPSVVQKLHHLNRRLPVLGYTWAAQGPTPVQSQLDGWTQYHAIGDFSRLPLLRAPDGSPFCWAHWLAGNVLSRRYDSTVAGQLTRFTAKSGLNGLLVDNVPSGSVTLSTNPAGRRMGSPALSPPACPGLQSTSARRESVICGPGGPPADHAFCTGYAAGVRRLVTLIRRDLGPQRFLVINPGIPVGQPRTGPWIRSARTLLTIAGGAMLEDFGTYRVRSAESFFSTSIAPELALMRSLPRTRFLVYGRPPWDRYLTYRQDYSVQRYVYAAYLLGANRNSAFSFVGSFGPPAAYVPGVVGYGRARGTDVYSDELVPLGTPESSSRVRTPNGLLLRRFSRGLVVVNPYESRGNRSRSFRLSRPMFTVDGAKVSRSLRLGGDPFPGPAQSAYILLDRRPFVQSGFDLRFNTPALLVPNEGEQLLRGGGDVEGLARTATIADYYRSAVVQIHAAEKPTAIRLGPTFAFRSGGLLRPGSSQAAQVPNISGAYHLVPDGRWHTLHLRPAGLAQTFRGVTGDPLRFVIRRWSVIRLLGSIDMSEATNR